MEELTAASDRARQAEGKVRTLGEDLRRAEAARQTATALSQTLTSRLPALLQVSTPHLQDKATAVKLRNFREAGRLHAEAEQTEAESVKAQLALQDAGRLVEQLRESAAAAAGESKECDALVDALSAQLELTRSKMLLARKLELEDLVTVHSIDLLESELDETNSELRARRSDLDPLPAFESLSLSPLQSPPSPVTPIPSRPPSASVLGPPSPAETETLESAIQQAVAANNFALAERLDRELRDHKQA